MTDRITKRELLLHATALGFRLTEHETSTLLSLVSGALDAVEGVGDTCAPSGPAGSRRVWGRPSRDADPLNALLHQVDVSVDSDGPLEGMRVAVKNSIAVAGVPMTAGSALLAEFVPTEDSVVVERLLRAGARIVATTNMDEFGLCAGGDTGRYGPVLNPFDNSRSAGGSSGGCAAALHYSGMDVAVGADQGGSVRVPAAWCGVLGLKPTYGLVPYTGAVGIDQTLDHIGPLARSTADLARVLEVMAGADERDPRQVRVPECPPYSAAVAEPTEDLKGLRIGRVREGFSDAVGIDTRVADAVDGAVDELRSLGATVEDVGLPEHLSAGPLCFGTTLEGMSALLAAGGNGYQWRGRYWTELAHALNDHWPTAADDLGTAAKVVLIAGAHLRERHRGAAYAAAQNQRAALVDAYRQALSTVDCLVMPTTPGLPHLIAGASEADRVLRGWDVLANTAPTNLTGHPALSLPLAQAAGLPVGVMFVGHPFGEAQLLRFAATSERQIGWLPAA